MIENKSSGFGGDKEVEVPWERARENFPGVMKDVIIWVGVWITWVLPLVKTLKLCLLQNVNFTLIYKN